MWAQRRFLLGAVALMALLVCMQQAYVRLADDRDLPSFNVLDSGSKSRPAGKNAPPAVSEWRRPPHIRKVMGLVFYGRRETVAILDCYLKRNLVKNGGTLDGVIFLERTSNEEDVALLDKIIASEPDYVRQLVDISQGGYASAYDEIEDDVLYVKIDDDIVYIEDTAIPSIVQTKADRPDLYSVSANVVNQPLISWIHWNLGAIKPYLPEVAKAHSESKHGDALDWRPSLLPAWEGPADFDVSNFSSSQKHRWLPVTGKVDHILGNTPIEATEYDAFGQGLQQWQIGAQQHYSLLENIEKDELWRYRYQTWDFQYKRMGIQFIAMMGRDINIAKPIHWDDEGYFSTEMPMKLGRHAVADGRGVVAHFGFSNQVVGGGMRTTDILDRYRSYALEKICKGPMLWLPEEDRVHE